MRRNSIRCLFSFVFFCLLDIRIHINSRLFHRLFWCLRLSSLRFHPKDFYSFLKDRIRSSTRHKSRKRVLHKWKALTSRRRWRRNSFQREGKFTEKLISTWVEAYRRSAKRWYMNFLMLSLCAELSIFAVEIFRSRILNNWQPTKEI